MKANSFKSSPLPYLLLFVLLFGFGSCHEPDVKLVNKVKSFEPSWSRVNEKYAYLDRNLELIETRFEQDFKEIKGLLTTIADSLRGRNYRKMLGDYEKISQERDTLRLQYSNQKANMVKSVNDFNKWEKEVMDGKVAKEDGFKELDKYKADYKLLDITADSMKVTLVDLVQRHNSILRNLSELMEIYTNYDIKLQ